MTKQENENGLPPVVESILASVSVCTSVSLNNNAISELSGIRAETYIETYEVEIDTMLQPLSLGDENAIESLKKHIELARRNGDVELVATLEREVAKKSKRWLIPQMREALIEDYFERDDKTLIDIKIQLDTGRITQEQYDEKRYIASGSQGSPLANNKNVDITFKVDGELKTKRLLSRDGKLASSIIKDNLSDDIARVIANRQTRAQNDAQHQLRTEALLASKHTIVNDYNSFTNFFTNDDGVESCDVNIPVTILNLAKLAKEQKELQLSEQDTPLLT